MVACGNLAGDLPASALKNTIRLPHELLHEGAMVSDLDTYRAANVLIRQHGDDAALEAAMRADAILEKGNLEG